MNPFKWDHLIDYGKILKKKSKILVGNRIYLKVLTENNATEEYCSWLNDAEVNRYLETRKTTIQELKEYLTEAESIVNTSGVDAFLTNSILQCIIMIEGVSAYTRYNIQGCSEILKSNEEFNNICKQLYIKYKVFNRICPEYKLLMIVSVSAYIAKVKNDNMLKPKINLDEPINI